MQSASDCFSSNPLFLILFIWWTRLLIQMPDSGFLTDPAQTDDDYPAANSFISHPPPVWFDCVFTGAACCPSIQSVGSRPSDLAPPLRAHLSPPASQMRSLPVFATNLIFPSFADLLTSSRLVLSFLGIQVYSSFFALDSAFTVSSSFCASSPTPDGVSGVLFLLIFLIFFIDLNMFFWFIGIDCNQVVLNYF